MLQLGGCSWVTQLTAKKKWPAPSWEEFGRSALDFTNGTEIMEILWRSYGDPMEILWRSTELIYSFAHAAKLWQAQHLVARSLKRLTTSCAILE